MTSERTPLLHQRGTDSNTNLKNEFKTIFLFTVPIMGAQLLEYSLQVASIISIGHISTIALAAATLGTMTANVTAFSLIQGICSALDTLLPSAWTSSHPNLVGLWSQRMTIAVTLILIPISIIWFTSESILLALKQEPEIAHLAALFLKYMSIGLPGYAFNYISRRYFQAQGRFSIPAGILVIVAPINIFLNYILVWGPAPLGMGFVGAPLATALSFDLIAILSLIAAVYLHIRDSRYNARILSSRRKSSERSEPSISTTVIRQNGTSPENGHSAKEFDKNDLRKIAWHPIDRRCLTDYKILMRLGISGIGQLAAVWWCWELVGLAASFMGAVSLAAQSVLLISSSTVYQIPVSLGIAASVRIGNFLGEGEARGAKLANDAALLMAAVSAAITSTIFTVFRNKWAYIFNSDPQVVDLVASVLPLVAAFQFVDALSEVAGGILRARGKQFLGALLNISAYYFVGLPFGLFFAFYKTVHLGLAGLWLGLAISLVYCAAVGVWICLRADWDWEVFVVTKRLKAARVAARKMAVGDVDSSQVSGEEIEHTLTGDGPFEAERQTNADV